MKKFILFIFAILLISACTINEKESLSGEMLSQIRKLPADASLIGYVNFNNIKNSSLYDLFHERAEEPFFHSDEYQEFFSETGFDLQKDVKEIYFAAGSEIDENHINGVFIAQGNYDPEKIIEYIRKNDDEKELVSEEINKYTLFNISDGNIHFCFQDNKTLVGGRRDLVVKILLDESNDNDIKLLPNIRNLKFKSYAWMVMEAKPFLDRIGRHDMADRLQGVYSIDNASFAVNLTDNFRFNGRCECSDEEKAELLQDAIKGAIAAAKLSVSDDRDAIDVLNKIEISVEGKQVTANSDMSRKEIEKLIDKGQITNI